MKYIVVGGLILNDMQYADGSTAHGYLGGAIYSVNGIRPYENEVLYLTKTGADWESQIGEFMTENKMPTEGIIPTLKHTMYSNVVYKPSGEWYEYSLYDDYDFGDWQIDARIKPEEILKFCDADTKGIYVEGGSDFDPKLVEEFHRISPNGKFMVELSTKWCNEADPRVYDQIAIADIYSLNKPESFNLFGTKTEEESIQKIIEIGKPCFYRIGSKGSYMIQDGQAWYAPLVDFGKSVDATGCGNCSTAASLYGYAEGFHPLMTAIKSNIASGINAAQFGPYLHFTEELTARINGYAQNIFDEMVGDNGKKEHVTPYVYESLYE